MVVGRRIAVEEGLHIHPALEIHIAEEEGLHIGLQEVVAEDTLVDRIAQVARHMAVEVGHKVAAGEDILAGHIGLGEGHHMAAGRKELAEGGILEEGIDSEAVDRMLAAEDVVHTVAAGEVVHTEVEGNLRNVSACPSAPSHTLTTLRRGSTVRRITALICHVV
jgi:hypothetical protein